jgi:hypothetical protein
MGSRTGSRGSVWLAVSVAANLVFVGLIVAWVLTMARRPSPDIVMNRQQKVIDSVGPADAAVVRHVGEQYQAIAMQYSSLFAQQNEKLLATVHAEPFDRAAFYDALRGFSTLRNQKEMAVHQIFADEMAALSPQGRERLSHYQIEVGFPTLRH